MGIFQKIFGAFSSKPPEDYYNVILSEIDIYVEHPKHGIQKINWEDILTIKLINTDDGPAGIDIWLALVGKNETCLIPQSHKGFDEVYNIVSKYEDFNFENFINSMSCTDNAEFLLWERK